ncbi:hypothetical protein [Actinoallomurus iriomotensis]|uniref:Spore-associated protein A n=1 Tax=Actinoallomurus iriomotensis TaxID=478107 RepID=A0A9W6S9U6_9ACTN|nr:hypothetical protein [Actinoallomurus iriomotensis]GLY88375.1 hypothetical protein Airi02_063040 [Actinoallomurus iriomotensis]
MRKFKQKAALTLTAAAMIAGSVVGVSGPAEAASSPIAACGGGSYHVIDRHNLGSVATVYLMYDGSTDCVVTWKTAYVGTPTRVEAWVMNESDRVEHADIDKDYSYYAGPVKTTAPGACIIWGGYAAGGGDGWYSDWSHCG